MNNFPQEMVICKAAKFVENGAGTYTFDVFVPAFAIIKDIVISGEALWDAATSASMEVGDYAHTAGAIGSAIDADGFFTAVDLKATDLTQGQHIDFNRPGGTQGAYMPLIEQDEGASPPDGNVHALQLMDGVDRWVRFKAVSVGAGTAGRTYVALTYVQAPTVTVTQ